MVQARDGVPLCLHNIDTATSESEAVRLSTSTREKLGVDIIAISDTAPANLCPDFKNHIGYIFISEVNDREALQLIYEEYVGLFDNMEDFKDILDMATVDGGYMLIDNMTDSTDICDIVYRYSQPVTGSMKRKYYCDDSL
jgi:hypothetical protein